MKQVLKTQKAPEAIGPYSQGVKAVDFVFVSGQIPIDPATGQKIAGGIVEQTRQVLENLKAVLEAAGLELVNVVKTTVFLTDMANFAAMNEVYGTYFEKNPPARSTVAVSALPKDAQVEIECIATKK